jgi:hypothetical protein
MVVYRFKFDQYTVENGLADDFFKILTEILNEGEILNYKPSKRDVIVKINYPTNFNTKLVDWIKEHATFDFEFETHSENRRTLTQIKMELERPVISVSYLLPLFSVESYLEL